MIDAITFETIVIDLLDTLYETQKDNMEAMAETMAECIANGGVVHVFGSGHSVGMGIDIKNRLGALVPIHIMETNDFVLKGGVTLEEFHDKVNVFERRPDVAEKLYSLYDIKPQDVFIVISNSGINGVVIDIASLAKKNGHKVIIVTSMKHTLAENSRHPSGIAKLTAVSSICNDMIAQSVAARVIEILAEKHIELPILTEDEEHNKALKEKYKDRA